MPINPIGMGNLDPEFKNSAPWLKPPVEIEITSQNSNELSVENQPNDTFFTPEGERIKKTIREQKASLEKELKIANEVEDKPITTKSKFDA